LSWSGPVGAVQNSLYNVGEDYYPDDFEKNPAPPKNLLFDFADEDFIGIIQPVLARGAPIKSVHQKGLVTGLVH